MKLLILTFFAVILSYSLLFDNDKDEKQPRINEARTIKKDVMPENELAIAPDTAIIYIQPTTPTSTMLRTDRKRLFLTTNIK